jgi:hypothetical protein
LFPVVPCGRRKKERKKGIAVGVSCVDLTYKYIRTYTHLLFLISIFSFFSLPPYLFFSSACDYYFPIGSRVGVGWRREGGRPTLCSLSLSPLFKHFLSLPDFSFRELLYKPLLYSDEMPPNIPPHI